MTKNDDLSLIFRQHTNQFHDRFTALHFHYFIFNGWFSKIQYIKNVCAFAGPDDRLVLYFSKMINTKVMAYAHGPLCKLVLFFVLTCSQGFDDLDEQVLENIFSQVLVLYQ